MPYEIKAECPCCSIKAISLNEIERVFGFRVMENKEKIPQSYCKSCRSKKCTPHNKKCGDA
jgi:hypothetical protein